MAKNNELRKRITQEFVNALNENRLPWESMWLSQRAYNATTEREYRGLNALWLAYQAGEKGYADPRWCTFKQASDNGWNVRKGEKGTQVEFWSIYDTKTRATLTLDEADAVVNKFPDRKDDMRMLAKSFVVFNAAQIDGIPELEKVNTDIDIAAIRAQRDILLQNMGLVFHEGGDQAFYRPSDDSLTMPVDTAFKDDYGYMSVLLHECGHATGHATRLNRDLSGRFGSESYAKEELRAEIASAFTSQALGFKASEEQKNAALENHKAYIQSWAKAIQDAPNELFAAIKDAEKISDYLIEKGEFERVQPAKDVINPDFEQRIIPLSERFNSENSDIRYSDRDYDYPFSHMGNGYDGYSMSNNARAAYADGEMPLSKWTKADILKAVKEINPDAVPLVSKVNVSLLKEHLLTQTSWHHTSMYYNRTNFYSVKKDVVESLTADVVRSWVSSKPSKETASRNIYRGDITYTEWSGKGKWKRPYDYKLTDVNIEEKGKFYIVTDDNGNELLRKKIDSNGTRVTNYAVEEQRRQREAERDRVRIENSSDAANAFYDSLEFKEYSHSGNIYPSGRKPGRWEYSMGLDKFFEQGEKRLSPNGNGGYTLETWNGSEWISENEEQVLYSERDPYNFSNRSLLTGALEEVAKNDIEKGETVDELIADAKLRYAEQRPVGNGIEKNKLNRLFKEREQLREKEKIMREDVLTLEKIMQAVGAEQKTYEADIARLEKRYHAPVDETFLTKLLSTIRTAENRIELISSQISTLQEGYRVINRMADTSKNDDLAM